MFASTNFRVHSFSLFNAQIFCKIYEKLCRLNRLLFQFYVSLPTNARLVYCCFSLTPNNFRILYGVAYSFDYMLKHVFVFNVLLSKETYMKIVDIHKMRFSF